MKVLFICTHNRCRSILSEAITNHLGLGKIIARSAGSQPATEVHPLSIKYLQQVGVSTESLQSQSWDDFDDFDPDLVITVCDSAAAEACPVWFGSTFKLHWGLSDPSQLSGDEQTVERAFLDCIAQIETRVETLLTLSQQDKSQWKGTLQKAGASL